MTSRERQFASLIWQRTGLSRHDLHRQTKTHPTLTGNAVAALIGHGLLREAAPYPAPVRGRPQVPLEIDPGRRSFLGIAIAPGQVATVVTNPLGHPISPERVLKVTADASISTATALLGDALDSTVIGVGVSITGMVLPREKRVLFSSSLPASEAISIHSLWNAAGEVPVTVRNDIHALAVRWQLGQKWVGGDVLLVGIEDGRLGASLLLNGRAMDGEISGAYELGHTRWNVETAKCYCGGAGCLERVVSTSQLRRFGAVTRRSISTIMADPAEDRHAAERVLHHLADGLANAVNFVRPRLLIIASPLVTQPFFADYLKREVPARWLPGLRDRVELRFWAQPNVQSAENAAWLALADIFGPPTPLTE